MTPAERKPTKVYLDEGEPVPMFLWEYWLRGSENSLSILESDPDFYTLDPEVYRRLILALREVIRLTPEK